MMSAQADCRTLTGLLDLAYQEAAAQCRRDGVTGSDPCQAAELAATVQERGLTPSVRRSETSWWPWRSMRPASASSMQGDLQGARRQARGARQLVDVDRGGAQRGQQAGPVLGADLGQAAARPARRLPAAAGSCAPSPVGRRAGSRSIGRAAASMTSSGSVAIVAPVLEQAVGAFRARVERMARHGEHLAALLGGHAGGDQRARAPRRLDDQHAQRDAGDDAVAAGEVLGARHEARRVLADQAAALADPALQLGVLRRIDVVEAAGEHGDRAGRAAPPRGRPRRCRGRGPRR